MRRLFLVGMSLGTRGWGSRCKPHYTIKKLVMVFWSRCGSDQAIFLEGRLVAEDLGFERRVTTEGGSFLFLYYDSCR